MNTLICTYTTCKKPGRINNTLCSANVMNRKNQNANINYPPPEGNLTPYNSNNLQAYYLTNSLSFGAKRIARKAFPLTKYHNKLSCPCCGEKMHDYNQEKAWQFSVETAEKYGEELSKHLFENIEKFQTTKRTLIKKIANTAIKHPEKNISELLDMLSGSHLSSLRKKQVRILNELTSTIENRTHKRPSLIKKWQQNQASRISNAKIEGEFKNRYLINSYLALLKKLDIRVPQKEIDRLYEKLPNSKNDLDAFVVKYKRRQPEETVFKMVKNTQPTVEHIIPFSESQDNHIGNLLLMCKDCNEARGNLSYNEFLKARPEMHKNIRRYFMDIKRVINSQTTDAKTRMRFKQYTSSVEKTLQTYTNNKLYN